MSLSRLQEHIHVTWTHVIWASNCLGAARKIKSKRNLNHGDVNLPAVIVLMAPTGEEGKQHTGSANDTERCFAWTTDRNKKSPIWFIVDSVEPHTCLGTAPGDEHTVHCIKGQEVNTGSARVGCDCLRLVFLWVHVWVCVCVCEWWNTEHVRICLQWELKTIGNLNRLKTKAENLPQTLNLSLHRSTKTLVPDPQPYAQNKNQYKGGWVQLPAAVSSCLLISCSWVDWPANQDPRRARPRWWRRWLGCTSCGGAGSVSPACLWSQQRSWRLVSPVGEGRSQRGESAALSLRGLVIKLCVTLKTRRNACMRSLRINHLPDIKHLMIA